MKNYTWLNSKPALEDSRFRLEDLKQFQGDQEMSPQCVRVLGFVDVLPVAYKKQCNLHKEQQLIIFTTPQILKIGTCFTAFDVLLQMTNIWRKRECFCHRRRSKCITSNRITIHKPHSIKGCILGKINNTFVHKAKYNDMHL